MNLKCYDIKFAFWYFCKLVLGSFQFHECPVPGCKFTCNNLVQLSVHRKTTHPQRQSQPLPQQNESQVPDQQNSSASKTNIIVQPHAQPPAIIKKRRLRIIEDDPMVRFCYQHSKLWI